ncbi:MAG: molybdenum cofactor guanylyltransferase [Bacillota bacterium]|nr:molybdenum cofactor guanylyltransferase [Bacillota bacterium]
MKFGICILTGGKSSRMKSFPKADLTLHNKTFLEILAEELSVFENKYISQNASQSYHYTGYQNVIDEYNEIGPLAGIVSTFHQSDVDILFVCSCDMPLIKKELVYFFLSKLEDYEGIFFEDEKHTYTTAGIYTRNLLLTMEEQIKNQDYRLYPILKRHQIKYLLVSDYAMDDDMFMNINTPEEYQNILKKTFTKKK